MSTIAAISTPNSPGGISVIRISGDDALIIAGKIFRPFGSKDVKNMQGYTCCYGEVYDGSERIDDCILTVFREPHSYTGENVVEISCHGGLYVTRLILEAVLKNGAENALPGEFTKRSFLNGKMDLTQAESVMDIISAKGRRELKMAENLRDGAAYKKTKSCSDRIISILGDLAAWADYPEEDIPAVEPEKLLGELNDIYALLSSIIEHYDSGRILREGIKTSIIGKPNVGKSTLFNCLSGCERSIVTEIAGTTRDVIEETVKLGDIVLRLSDTAGIHDTDDKIEKIGIDIAVKSIDNSDLVIAVFDGSCPLCTDDYEILESIKNRKSIAVVNKNDIENVIEYDIIKKYIKHIVYLSAKNSTGVEQLENIIESEFMLNEIDFDNTIAANERQKKCIDSAMINIKEAIIAIESGEFLDAVTILIDAAEQSLLELTGEKVTDAVVDEVFSRFCVGK